MANKTSKIFYRIDIRKTMEEMNLQAPFSVKIAGDDRDCAKGALYRIKYAIEAECDKRFKIESYNNGMHAEVTRII